MKRIAAIALVVLLACSVDLSGPTLSTTVTPEKILAAGDVANCLRYKDAETATLIQSRLPGTVLALGDLAYPDGTAADWTCYDATWGAFKAVTKPQPGNHDYNTLGAKPYFDYFNGVGIDSGPAGHRSRGWYAFDLNGWRIYMLNIGVSLSSTSAQYAWYKADLLANPRSCILVAVHKPLFASNNTSVNLSPSLTNVWNRLVAAKGELFISGSYHIYERFAKQLSNRTASSSGVRQLVVGTGGASVASTAPLPAPNSEVIIPAKHGVLELMLSPTGYTGQFISIDGVVRDAFSGSC